MALITAGDIVEFYERGDALAAPNDSVRCASCEGIIRTGDDYSPYVKRAADSLRSLPAIIAVCKPCTYTAMITRSAP